LSSKRQQVHYLAKLLPLLLTAAVLGAVDTSPHRIVSLSPSTTEILSGVGAFAQVVAVSQYCTYPPAVSKLPRVGGWETSDAEKIVALRPDLVVLTRAQEPFIADKLRAFSLRWIAVPSDTLSDTFTAIDMIGKATGHETKAHELSAQTRASLDRTRNETKGLPPRSVLLVVSRTPGSLSDLYVATKGSYLVDLLEIAGGRSVAAPDKAGYSKLSKEALLSLNPDVIIDMVHTATSNLGERTLEVWNDLPELQAVHNKRVYSLDDQFVVHPSQFVAHTAEVFERLLHPELAGKGTH
jgi:iron complex transport system substrate-binding protein